MCGIYAIYGGSGRAERNGVLASIRTLRHRGPDATGVWTAEHAQIGLAHARLSIIDLSTGDQPIASESDEIRVVVNGEFYDFERIRQALEGKGHRFRTRSDSEVLVHLYEEHGPACLQHLRGEFAFVLWDDRDRTLFAARDRFGIKPLFYAEHDGALHIASEMKAIFAAGVPARWDFDVLFAVHASIVHDPDRTHFAGIRQIPPGCYLTARDGRASVHRYWDFDYPPAERAGSTIEPPDAVEQVRDKLDEAIKLRLRADVPVACYLSGGIDSCAVLGMAARHVNRPLKSFTIGFADSRYDESGIAEGQARLSGADFVAVTLNQRDLADSFADAIHHAERPFENGHCIAKFALSRTVRDAGIKVVLTGEGSDEIFAGYRVFLPDLDPSDDNPSWWSGNTSSHRLEGDRAKKASGAFASMRPGASFDAARRRLGFCPTILKALSGYGSIRSSFLSADFLAPYRDRDCFDDLLRALDVPSQLTGRAPLHQSLYLWSKTSLPNYVLSNLGDRMEMAHSVEGRLPFLDHALVELVVKLPPTTKIRGGIQKHILREAVRPYVTDKVRSMPKRMFWAPPAALRLDAPLFALMRDILSGPLLDGIGIYDRSKIMALIDRLPKLKRRQRDIVDRALMHMTSLCIMHDRFVRASAPRL